MKKRILKAFFGVLIVFTIGSLAIGVKGAAICLVTYALLILGIKLVLDALMEK